jgi:hypothetical protein
VQQQQHAAHAGNSDWHPVASGQQCKSEMCSSVAWLPVNNNNNQSL